MIDHLILARSAWCMVQCMVHGAWRLVHGAWCSAWYLVYSAWCMVRGGMAWRGVADGLRRITANYGDTATRRHAIVLTFVVSRVAMEVQLPW